MAILMSFGDGDSLEDRPYPDSSFHNQAFSYLHFTKYLSHQQEYQDYSTNSIFNIKKTNTAINTFQLSAKPPAYSISQPPPFPATPFPSRGLSLEPLRLQDLTGFRSCIWITTQSLQQHLVKAWHGWRMAMATPTMKAPMGLRDNWWFS